MADASERIVILSAVVLVIILWLPNSGLIQTIVTIDDVEVEIDTSRNHYYLGDNFTANVYLVNTRSRDVWMEAIQGVMFSGLSQFDPILPIAVLIEMDGRLLIPANSKVFLIDRLFTPRRAGEFQIQCSGRRKKVVIFESKSENETVKANMNTPLFITEMEATLFIANVGPNLITWVSVYTIEREVDQDWIEVSPFPPMSAWTAELRLLPPNHTSSQKIKIDTLESGLYRVSKTVEDSVTQESITLIVEFEILTG